MIKFLTMLRNTGPWLCSKTSRFPQHVLFRADHIHRCHADWSCSASADPQPWGNSTSPKSPNVACWMPAFVIICVHIAQNTQLYIYIPICIYAYIRILYIAYCTTLHYILFHSIIYITLTHITSHNIALRRTIIALHHIALHHITWDHITLYDITSHYR